MSANGPGLHLSTLFNKSPCSVDTWLLFFPLHLRSEFIQPPFGLFLNSLIALRLFPSSRPPTQLHFPLGTPAETSLQDFEFLPSHIVASSVSDILLW